MPMGVFDESTEKRVWERVRGEAPQQSLQALATSEKAAAAVFQRLARMAQGPEKTQLRLLAEESRRHERILRGIHCLTSGKALSIRTAAPAADPAPVALRKCYATALRAARAYADRTGDPEYGPVFGAMAAREQAHCAVILEILGMTGHS